MTDTEVRLWLDEWLKNNLNDDDRQPHVFVERRANHS